ncbi:MAG: DUF58 domain-containing protein, partial [Anaerolineae bacterium]
PPILLKTNKLWQNGVMSPKKRAPTAVTIELRQRFPLFVLGFLLAAAVLLPDRAWNTLLVGLGGLYLLAYGWTRWLIHNLHAERRLRFNWVAVGDRLEEQFAIANRSPVPALWVEVSDESNLPGYTAAVVRSVGANTSDRWRQWAVCERRGQYHLGPWAIQSGDPFGLFVGKRTYAAQTEIIIHPPIHGRLPLPLPTGTSSGRTRTRERLWQATANAVTVREYRPHDPYRWIHWPTSAKRDALFVREFEQDAAGDIWLLLDLEAEIQVGSGIDSTEEQAVLLAASLAARALRHNRAVGLAAYGRTPQVIPPGRGTGHQWRILQALALVHADSTHDLRVGLRDLVRLGKRGATAVLITPTRRLNWLPNLYDLARRGLSASVILLDRTSFGAADSNQGLPALLRQQGASCYPIRQGDIGQPLENPERRGFWEFYVTPTGKAVLKSELTG